MKGGMEKDKKNKRQGFPFPTGQRWGRACGALPAKAPWLRIPRVSLPPGAPALPQPGRCCCPGGTLLNWLSLLFLYQGRRGRVLALWVRGSHQSPRSRCWASPALWNFSSPFLEGHGDPDLPALGAISIRFFEEPALPCPGLSFVLLALSSCSQRGQPGWPGVWERLKNPEQVMNHPHPHPAFLDPPGGAELPALCSCVVPPAP